MHHTLPFLRSVALLVMLALTSSAQAQWRDLAPISNGAFEKIDFVDENTAFALVSLHRNQLAIFRTNDGGSTWDSIGIDLFGSKTYYLQNLDFVDANIGYVTFRLAQPSLTFKVMKTTNGGESWQDIGPENMPVGGGLSGIQFVNAQTGWLGVGNGLYRTQNGGDSWHKDSLSGFHSIDDVSLFNEQKGVAIAWDGTFFYKGILYITENGGNSWDTVVFEGNQTTLYRVQYLDANTIFALTQNNWKEGQRIFKSYDHGKTWDTLQIKFVLDSADEIKDMYFNTSQIGHIITFNGNIYRTTDGGKKWIHQYSGEANMRFITTNGTSLLAGGAYGVLVKNDKILHRPQPPTASFGFYPNPCSAQEKLNTTLPDGTRVHIHDLQGRSIGVVTVQQQQIPLSAVHIPRGTVVFSVPALALRELVVIHNN